MLDLVVLVALAAVLGLALGGSLEGLRRPVRWLPLVVGALLAEVLLVSTPFAAHAWALRWGSWLWIGSLAAIALTLGRNVVASRRFERAAWLVALLGVSLNLTAVLANGGTMPQSPEARAAAGVRLDRVAVDPEHPVWRNVSVMTDQSRLTQLADVIPLPGFLPSRNVVSVGDLLLVSGLAVWAFLAARSRPRMAEAIDMSGRVPSANAATPGHRGRVVARQMSLRVRRPDGSLPDRRA